MTHSFSSNVEARLAALILALATAVVLASGGCSNGYAPQNGDIVFQTSRSAQSEAIQRATDSPYSHMGVVFLRDEKPFVYEAVEPVKLTPLGQWIRRGEGGHFVAKRLEAADELLTEAALQRMYEVGESFQGKHYDLYFEWSDERIYCSELVWKIYERGAGVEIGKLETIGDFDLSEPMVAAKVEERFGGPPPADEPVISPARMLASPQLVTVYQR
jgi:hypothetical protein